MATRTTRRRRREASVADVEDAAIGRGSAASRRIIALGFLLISAAAIGLAVWQPTQLTEELAPLWTHAGPALAIGPALLLGLYIALRVFGFWSLSVWRWFIALSLTTAAALTGLHLFEITEIRGAPIESRYTAELSALSQLEVIGILAALSASAALCIAPYRAIRARRSSRRAKHMNDRGADWLADMDVSQSELGAEPGLQDAQALDDGTDLPDTATAVDRSRVIVPDQESPPRTPRYPEPIGVLRDKARARAEARLNAKEADGKRPEPERRQAEERAAQEQPRIVVPGTTDDDKDGKVDDRMRAYRERYIRPRASERQRDAEPDEQSAVVADDTPETNATEARAWNEQDARVTDAAADHGDAQDEPFIMDAHDRSDRADGFNANALVSEDDEDEWMPPSTVRDSTDDDEESWGAAASPDEQGDDQGDDQAVTEVEDWDSPPPGRPVPDSEEIEDARDDDEERIGRSGQELLDSFDPFAGLPKVAWRFPSFKLFEEQPAVELDTDAHLETADAIQETLQEYGIEVDVTEVRPGPTVTLYGLRPGWDRRYRSVREKNEEGVIVTRREETGRTRIKVDTIAKLDDDLALQLKAASVRIEPIPGTNLIGVEVPNPESETVYMRPQLQSEEYRKARGKSKLAFPLGKGSGGEPVVADLARMPHLLVAGSTGSGKSVFINSLITSLITRATPEDLRFVMIDPKRVELTIYNGIPHLITPVIIDTPKVVNALHWMVQQMEERLELLAREGARDITSYNEKTGDERRMPYLVLIVDELADLMMTAGKAVEHGLVRLAQMGRATGIHLVVATQRPSVNVITGLIKANFPTRISFMVTSLVDSRTILDGAGAEKLLGRGDMLYLPQDASRPIRIQSAFISGQESDAVVDAWRAQSGGYVPPELPELVTPEDIGLQSRGRSSSDGAGDSNGAKRNGANGDDILEQARSLADLYNGKVSTSLLQRRLGIGYPRAARLRDRLVEEGLAKAEIPNAPAETAGRGLRRSREQDELED